MARWMAGLFGERLETKTAADRRANQGAGYFFGGNPYVHGWDVDRMVRDGYEKVIWIFKSVDAIAEKASSWPIRSFKGDKDDDPSEWKKVKDPILDLLNIRTNDLDGPAKAFRYRLSSQLLLSKPGVFIEVIPNKVGNAIAALNLLPPAITYPVPDDDGVIRTFEIQMATGERPRIARYDPDKKRGVVWIRKPHPTNPYLSATPLDAAGISIDLDFYARLYNRNFLLNDGRAGQLVAIKGGLSPEDAAEIKRRFQPGMGGVGRTTVIEADSVSVQDTAVTPRDAQYAELRAITKEDLLIAMGTPESVLGNASGRTFDNADAERENWLTDTVTDHAGWIETGLEILTEGGIDDDRFLWHDSSREWVLQRPQRARADKAREDFDAGRITLKQFWDIADYEVEPELDEAPGVNVIWLDANGKMPTGAPDEVERAMGLQAAGMGAFPPEGAPAGEGEEEVAPEGEEGALAPEPATFNGWDAEEAVTDGSWNAESAAVVPIDRARERASLRKALLSDDPLELKAFLAATATEDL